MELASEHSVNLDISHLSTPAVGLVKMFENQLHTDVTFQVSGQVVRAHRIILASQSDYFDCLLFGPMKEGRATEITLKETPAEAFRELLKFMYSGSVKSVNLTTALDLHILADRYGFTFLKDEIEAHLITIISVDNVLLFHSHAHVSSAIQLKERCETFMDHNAKSVIKSRSLPCLPKENFKLLIARDTFVVEEVEIFDAVKKWIEHNKVDKNDAVDLLECVRLTEIPYGELKSRVLPSGLYQREAVTEAMRGSQVSDRECIATRGKTGENLNLFQESGSKLLTCTNYLLDIVPEKGDNWSCVSDFLFSLACPANNNPACITVKFDDMYIVNQVTFDGYADRSCTRNAENERTPFCYQVWVSTDGNQWITILDYSRLKCYARQRLFFAKMAIRYLRILQTRGKEKFTLNLDSCSYVGPVPYKFRHLGLIAPFVPMTPDFSQCLRQLENDRVARVFLTFTQPYSVNTIRFKLHGLGGSADVSVYVTTQNRTKNYQLVAEFKDIDLSSTLQAQFEERAVSIVSIIVSHMRLPNEEDSPRPDNPIPWFMVRDLTLQTVDY